MSNGHLRRSAAVRGREPAVAERTDFAEPRPATGETVLDGRDSFPRGTAPFPQVCPPDPATAAAMLAHQFAEPLGAIAANAQTLQLLLGSRTDLHPDVNAAVAAIESDVERAASMMLATRLLFSPTTMAVAPVDIAGPLRSALRRTVPVAVRAGVVLRARIEDLLWADAEVVLLEQAFLNLLLNAVEAAATAAHDDRAVDVVARASASTVRVVVSDTGPGFSPEALRHAGEAFFTTKGPGKLGLGMALVCKVARAHGATLSILNGEQGGARPILSFPRVEPLPVDPNRGGPTP